jgi:hypothetical protein
LIRPILTLQIVIRGKVRIFSGGIAEGLLDVNGRQIIVKDIAGLTALLETA